MKIIAYNPGYGYGSERQVYLGGEPFLLGGTNTVPASVTIEVPASYERGTFTAAVLYPFCEWVEHHTQSYRVIPSTNWRPTVLEDFLTAEIYPSHGYDYSSRSLTDQFPPSVVREFVAAKKAWFVGSLAAAEPGQRSSAADLNAGHERLHRCFTVLGFLRAAHVQELEDAYFAEESALVADPRGISDDRLERMVIELQSFRAREALASEIVRRIVDLEEPGSRFPLLAEAVASESTGGLGILRNAVDRAVRGQPEDWQDRRLANLPQNLRGASIDLTNASVQWYLEPMQLLLGLRATRIPLHAGYSRRERKLLVVKHEGRTVYFRADRSLIRRVVRAGGTLAFHGNTLVVHRDEIGGAIQEMERVQALAFLKPDDIAERILAAEPRLSQARTLAEQARTDPTAARRLVDLAMESLFGIDPDVAAAILRARQRDEPA